MKQSNKSEIVSIGKGIGIILMVIGHSGCPLIFHDFIYVFHMPLFFFLSGYCFKEKYLYNIKLFCLRRIKGLYIPFIKYSLIFLLLHNALYNINLQKTYYDLNESIDRALHIIFSMTDNDALLGGFWFLRVSLYSSILSLFLIKYIKNTTYLIAVVTISSFLCSIFQLQVPFIGDVSLVLFATSLFLSGVLLNNLKNNKFNNLYTSFSGILLCCGLVYIDSLFFNTEMLTYTYKEFFPFWTSSILGILMILGICNHIKGYSKKILIWIGNHTLPILTWHFLCFKLVSFIIIRLYGLPILNLSAFPVIKEYANEGWWLIYCILGFSIPLIFIYIISLCRKYI